MKSGGEEKNVGGVLMGRELDGSEICDGLNDVGSVAKSEIGICVNVEGVEGEWNVFGIWSDVNVDEDLVDVVEPQVEV